jgi:hypothetical protein
MEQAACFETKYEESENRSKMAGCGKCAVCGRKLTDPESVLRGMGPICAGKQSAEESLSNREDSFHDIYLNIPITEGIILKREGGKVYTNVPHAVVRHSPDGYEWGYGGSGPADLALNIVEAVLNLIGFKGRRLTLSKGSCWDMTQALHQDFKRGFLAAVPKQGGVVHLKMVVSWIIKNVKKNKEIQWDADQLRY